MNKTYLRIQQFLGLLGLGDLHFGWLSETGRGLNNWLKKIKIAMVKNTSILDIRA
jgi:hypothetical protein